MVTYHFKATDLFALLMYSDIGFTDLCFGRACLVEFWEVVVVNA